VPSVVTKFYPTVKPVLIVSQIQDVGGIFNNGGRFRQNKRNAESASKSSLHFFRFAFSNYLPLLTAMMFFLLAS